MNVMKTTIVRARVPEELKRHFETFAASRGWNLSHAIRQLMINYVEQEKEISFRLEETLEAIEGVRTGRVVDGDDVMAWLATWGTDEETDPPL